MEDVEVIVVHSSWRGRLTSILVPAILLALGAYGLLVGGPNVVNVLFGLIGGFLVAVGLFDFPLETHFGPDAIERRCALRRHRLGWGDVSTVRRIAVRKLARRGERGSGGLVAVVGRRNYLLSDRAESEFEHDALRRAANAWPEMRFSASEPAADRPPTWLYKRRGVDGPVDER